MTQAVKMLNEWARTKGLKRMATKKIIQQPNAALIADCPPRYFFATGFQFISSVIGAVALSSSLLMRKRPSRATSY